MNSGIPLQTTAIFFLVNIYIKQGISLEYVMVDFICMGLLDLWTENYKMKSLSHSAIRTRDLPLTKRTCWALVY